MTSFARYFDENKKLVNVSMDDVEALIANQENKEDIADLIYCRYYERYLKIFFYESKETTTYQYDKGVEYKKNIFNTEYKNGFVIMASCCLLIETLSAFIEGDNETPKGEGRQSFETVFDKAKKYKNRLQEFSKQNFYKAVRCGILHQGETYKSFKIRRTGDLFNKTESAINAALFAKELKAFLKGYVNELKSSKWDSEAWDNCRVKLRHIINNSRL